MEKSYKKITIKDIAELAGVSIGTVDRVIHNRGEVSKKTSDKILKITKTLNYQPHVLASALASKKNMLFSVLMPANDSESSFWKIPLVGIDKAINEIKHYGIRCTKHLYSISDKQSFIEEAYQAISQNPDGMIIVPALQDEAARIAKLCNEKEIPFAFFNSSLESKGQICFVGQDAMQSGRLAGKLMDLCTNEGYEILVISITSFLKNNRHILERKQGFIEYFERSSNNTRKLRTLDIDSLNIGDLYLELRKVFSEDNSIKGVFVTNSRVFHIAHFLESEKLQNISLIGYDLTKENIIYLEKEIITFLINQKPVEQAYRSVLSLFNKLFLKQDVPKEIHLPIEIVTKENLKYYDEY